MFRVFSVTKSKNTRTQPQGRAGVVMKSFPKDFHGLGPKSALKSLQESRQFPGPHSFSTSRGYVASCCGVPDTEPQLHSALLADRLTSFVHLGLLPLNFGSYLDRKTLPAPLFPSYLLASALMPSSLTATFPGVPSCSNTGERDSDWPTSFEHRALS